MSVYKELRFLPMRIGDLFNLHRGRRGISANDPHFGKTPYIAAASRNNSQVGWVKEDALFPGGWLAIVNTGAGGVGYCTYQPVPFWASNNVTALEPKREHLTPEALIVMASIIRLQCFGFYRYGSIANNRRVTNQRIMVPAIKNTDGTIEADWEGMSRLGAELLEQVVTHAHSARQARSTDDDNLPELRFEPMFITDVFESMTASKAWYDKSKLTFAGVASYPFVSRTKASNGVDGFCPRQDKEPEPGNALTIGLDTQTIGYQPVPFYTSQNIQVLRHDRLNEHNAPVLSSLLKEQMGKFSWGGNGATLGRLKATQIMVPVVTDSSGKNVVDWEGMTAYGHVLRVRAERSLEPVLGEAS